LINTELIIIIFLNCNSRKTIPCLDMNKDVTRIANSSFLLNSTKCKSEVGWGWVEFNMHEIWGQADGRVGERAVPFPMPCSCIPVCPQEASFFVSDPINRCQKALQEATGCLHFARALF
jgi:hypothetical protein